EEGTSSLQANTALCVAPDACAPGTMELVPATASTPALCEVCEPGQWCAGADAQPQACDDATWDDDGDPATPCVPKTTCAAGSFVKDAGSPLADRTCTSCEPGSFSPTTNAPT